MVQYTGKPVIDFTSYITERADHFTGREWVFQAIDNWLADDNGPRFFLLTGEPGSGKTAIASRLAQFDHGLIPSPEGLHYLSLGFISAIHFCSARDSRWTNPHIFVESLAMQLAERFPAYAKALSEKSGDRQIHIEIQQHIEQGQGIGVIVNQLEASAVAPEDAFNRLIREPLEALLKEEFDQQIVILIDALDEALDYSGNVNIVSLLNRNGNLSSRVRFLLTSRQDARIEHAFLEAVELVLSSAEQERHHRGDIRRYIQSRLSNDKELVKEATRLESAQLRIVVETIGRKAEGNFLYVRFLLDAVAKGLRQLTELERLPEGLDSLYFDSLARVVRLGKHDWLSAYAPLIGVLSVSQDSLTFPQLRAFTRQSEASLWKYLGDLQQFIEETKLQDEKVVHETRYRLYHQSIIDFLHCPSLSLEKRQVRNDFYLSAQEWHKLLINWCEQGNISVIWNDVKRDPIEQGRREYARQHYITHLYLVQQWDRLFAVLDQGSYGQAKVHLRSSMYSYIQDLELGQQAAAWEGWTIEEGLGHLSQLWRYTLLRCSLSSRADDYPLELFELFPLLNRTQKALGLAESMTNPSEKAIALLRIAKYMMPSESKDLQILLKAYEVAQLVEDPLQRVWIVKETAIAFAKAGHRERAEEAIYSIEEVAHSIEDDHQKIEVLRMLAITFARMQQWERASLVCTEAEKVARLKEHPNRILAQIAKDLIEAQQLQRAIELCTEAEANAQLAENNHLRDFILEEVSSVYAKAQQWERAERVAHSIESSFLRAKALLDIARYLVEALQWEHASVVGIQAEEVARPLKDSALKIEALSMAVKALCEMQQWGRVSEVITSAEKIALSLESDPEASEAWSILAKGLATAQQWEGAEKATRMIQDKEQKARALSIIALALMKTNQFERASWLADEAETIACSQKDEYEEDKILGELADVLAEAKQWEQAEKVVSSINSDYIKAKALSAIACALIRVTQLERARVVGAQAEEVARSIEINHLKARVLAEIAQNLAQVEQWEQANRLATEAEEVTHSLKGFLKGLALEQVAIAFAKAQQWEKAEEIAHLPGSFGSGALKELVRVFAKAQQWERAQEVASSIKDEYLKLEALGEIVAALTEAQQWERVTTVLNSIDDIYYYTTTMIRVIEVLAKAQQWELAQDLADSIVASFLRVEAIGEVAAALIEAKQWEQVNRVEAEIEALVGLIAEEDSSHKDMSLKAIATAFAKMRRWQRAEDFIGLIKDSKVKIEVLRQVAEILGAANEYKALLCFVQNAWVQATTREYAVQLLPLTMDLIFLKPEIGPAFCEAFAWVDTFLKG